MSYFNMVCDVCGREVFSCTFVNGMKFCAKCYQETFGETDKDRKIADLEAKLVESEKKILELQEDSIRDNMRYIEELAEKEKEIESYKHFKITIGTMENNQVDISSTTYTDQDKISFALEQLEKVREFCEKELKECDKLLKTEFEDDFYIQSVMARESMCFDFRRTIDSQIKQLKGKK